MSDFKAIVIGGSAGSFPIASEILEAIPSDFSIPIIFGMHRLKHIKSGFAEALQLKSKISVVEPDDKDRISKNKAYVAPANYHLLTELGGSFALSSEEMVHHSRPSIDVLFCSAGYTYGNKMLAIILSGANKDGAKGMQYAHEKGAYTIVQDPDDCKVPTMTKAVLDLIKPDKVLNTKEIIEFIKNLK